MGRYSGSKFASGHTTAIPLAGRIADIAVDFPEVTKISLGMIINFGGVHGSVHAIKFTDESGCVLVTATQPGSRQEMRVYTNDPHSTKVRLAIWARNNSIHISFGGRRSRESR